MLYRAYDAMQWMVRPMNAWAGLMGTAFEFPHLDTPYSAPFSASFEMMERLTRTYHKPDFEIETVEVAGKSYGIEEEIIDGRPFADLKHFKKVAQGRAKAPKQPPLLIVAPLSGHYATLLRDTVGTALQHFDVYITDWHNARDVPLSAGSFNLDDYVGYVRGFLNMFDRRPHVMGVCQPSVPVFAATALMAKDKASKRPASLTMMGGPIDTRRCPTEVNSFAEEKEFDWFAQNMVYTVPASYRGQSRMVYPGFLQLISFMSMNPDLHTRSHVQFFNHLVAGDGDSAEKHREFYNEYLAVMDIPAEFYLDTLKKVFKEHHLPLGKLEIGGRPVRPDSITDIPVLTIEGEKDDITGYGQTEAAHDLLPNLPSKWKSHYVQKGAGHYGVFNGRRWREQIYPKVVAFADKAEAAL